MSGVGSGTAGHGMAWYVSDYQSSTGTVLHHLTATKQNNKNKEVKNNNNIKKIKNKHKIS